MAGTDVLGVVTIMATYVDPGALKDHPLLMKEVMPGDFTVYIHGLAVGRIYLQVVGDDQEAWFWVITGPYLPVHLLPAKGQAETRTKARHAFRRKFIQWHEWAETLGHEVVWNTKL